MAYNSALQLLAQRTGSNLSPQQPLSSYATNGKFDVSSLKRAFADYGAANPGWWKSFAGSDASQDGGLGATLSPFSSGGSVGGGYVSAAPAPSAGGNANPTAGGPSFPPYMQPPSYWEQALPYAQWGQQYQMPSLYTRPPQLGMGGGIPGLSGLLGIFG